MTRIVIGIAALTLCGTFCTTSLLWDATNPHAYIEVTGLSLSAKDLEESGVRYQRDEDSGRVFVEKSTVRKLGDYSIRALGTPFTVTIDVAGAVTAILVVGTVMDAKEDWHTERQFHPDDPHPIVIYPGHDNDGWPNRWSKGWSEEHR